MRTRPRPNPTPRSAANVALLTGVWFDVADVDGQSGVEALRAILLEAGRRRARGCASEFATRAYPPASRQAGAAGRGTHPQWSIRERVFRADLPPIWLVSVLYHIVKGAAEDISSGRLDPSDARNSSSQRCSPPTQTPMNPSHP